MADIKQFADAVLKGAGAPTPASYIPQIAQFFQGRFQGAPVARAGAALGGAATLQAQEEEERRKAAEAARIRQIQDQLDPSKYEKRRKDDGGFAFFSPDGKEIDVDTFAKRTGQRRVDVLKDSENPVDQQYIHDWSTMNDITQALWSNDQIAIQGLTQAGVIKPNQRPEDLAKKLIEKYPHIYGKGNYEKSFRNLGSPVFKLRVDDPMSWGGGSGAGGFQL